MPEDILHEGIIERMQPGKSQWQKRYAVLTMTAILLFKGDQALHAAPSETIAYIDLLVKDNVKATPKHSQLSDKLGKAVVNILAAKAFMEAAANRDGAEEDDPERVENLAKAKHEETKLTFQIQTTKATIECRALT
jgi:hypothetical protein